MSIPIVTQAQLRELRELRSRQTRQKALEAEIRAALGANAAIEPGPLTATLSTKQSRRLSAELLRQSLGVGPANEILSRMPLTTSRVLQVRRQSRQSARATRRSARRPPRPA